MGESSCCIADELVLVPPRRHRLKLASPGGHSLVGAPAPGANSLARLLARWASPPAALRTSWCSSFPGLHRLGLAWRGCATPRGERRAHGPRSDSMSSPLLWRRSLVGAPAPGANSVARQLARGASPPAASRTSWCSSLPGGTGLSSPLPGGIVL